MVVPLPEGDVPGDIHTLGEELEQLAVDFIQLHAVVF